MKYKAKGLVVLAMGLLGVGCATANLLVDNTLIGVILMLICVANVWQGVAMVREA